MVEAPGWPGIPARWTSSAKDGIGAALSEGSRVWFTVSHGIVNEIYYPRVDQACVRDLGLIVTDGDTFFAEVKRWVYSAMQIGSRSLGEFRAGPFRDASHPWRRAGRRREPETRSSPDRARPA